jgi:hypothetical protein
MVSTSRCVSSAGLPPIGLLRLPQMSPRCGSKPLRGTAGDQRVHPRAAALVFARIPVGVEPADEFAVLVVNVVVADLRVPVGDALLFGHADAVEAVNQVEHPGHHLFQREVGPQRLLVEIVESGALFFRVVSHVPRLEFRRARALDGPPELQQLAIFFAEAALRLGFQVLEKMEGAGAVVGHAVFEHQVGEVGEAQKTRLLAPQFQNAADERAIVAAFLGGADAVGLVEVAAGGGVIHVGHHRQVIGRLQSEAPAFQSLALGAVAGGGDGRRRQTGEIRLIGNHQFESVGGIEDVLAELGGDLRQFDVELLQFFLAGRVQIGAMAAESVDGLVEKAPPLAGDGFAFGVAAKALMPCHNSWWSGIPE